MSSVATIIRKVYFFRVAHKERFMGLFEDVAKQVDGLAWDTQGRYLPVTGEDTLLALFISRDAYPIRLQFARIRRDNLPLIEKAGEISGLDIDEDAGIMDWAHLVIFPDGIVAAEFNQDAPRIRRLGQYLLFKSAGILKESPKFLPLFQRNVMHELERFDYATRLELEAKPVEADVIAQANENIGREFEACKNAGKPNKVLLVLRNQSPKNSGLLDVAKALFSNPKSRESLTKLKIFGRSGGNSKPLDMLEEYLISTEKFVRKDARTRSLNSENAFDLIESAYAEKKHLFEHAAVANDFEE